MGVITRWPNVFTRLEIAPGGVLIGWGGISGSQTFYVQGAGAKYPGNDSSDGLSFKKPLATITKALSKCVSMRNDVIYILNYWTPAGETWPIAVNKKAVHIIGVAQPGLPSPAIVPASTTAAFTINEDGSYCEIAYLTISGGTGYAGISLGAVTGTNTKPEGVYIHDCVFGHRWFGTPTSGIDSPEYGAIGLRIERCTFLGDAANFTGGITTNGIDLATTSAFHENAQIIDNLFTGCTRGIFLNKGKDCEIRGNRFGVDDGGGVDQAIDLTNCLGCTIDDNHTGSRMAAGGTSTCYSDQDGGVVNAWGFNTNGGSYQAAV